MVGVAVEVNSYDFSGKYSLSEAIKAQQRESRTVDAKLKAGQHRVVARAGRLVFQSRRFARS